MRLERSAKAAPKINNNTSREKIPWNSHGWWQGQQQPITGI